MNRLKFAALAWAAVSLAGVTAAIATPPSGNISRNQLAVGKVTDTIDIQRSEPTDFHIDVVTIDPGGNSGWHTHPGPEYSVIKAGEVVLVRAPNCDPITLKAGQGFFTPGGTAHMAHNDGKEPAELYVTYTVPAGPTVLRQDIDEHCGDKPGEEKPGEEKPAPAPKNK
jgi:quercetin dioxygenase-like cupin family protein